MCRAMREIQAELDEKKRLSQENARLRQEISRYQQEIAQQVREIARLREILDRHGAAY